MLSMRWTGVAFACGRMVFSWRSEQIAISRAICEGSRLGSGSSEGVGQISTGELAKRVGVQ